MAEEYEWVETTEHIILEFGSRTNPADSWLNHADEGIQLVGLDSDEVFFKAGNTVFRGFYEDNAICEDLVFTIRGDIPTAQEEEEPREDGPFAQDSPARAMTGEEGDDIEAPRDNRAVMEDYDEEPIDATMDFVGLVTKKIIFEKVVLDVNEPTIEGNLHLNTDAKKYESSDRGGATTTSIRGGEATGREMDIERQ
ncbi:hypothetical protein BGW41_005367 [Actinomortierella wolfii]|nr:hypothetical protein BGW41_005367 [Actinomortierella wolfii]